MREGYKMTKLGEIPVDWEVKLLDDCAKRGSGHTPSKQFSEYYNGGIKWISLRDSKSLDNRWITKTKIEISLEGIKNSSAVLHPKGTVLLSRDAGIGKSAIMFEKMAVSQHFMTWECSKALNNWYLYYLLQEMKPIFERVAIGSTIKTIGLGFFKKMKIICPPLQEQKKIAQILSTVDEKIDLTQSKIKATQALKKGLMQQLLTKGIGHTEFKPSKLGEIPLDWEVVPIYELRNKNDRYAFTGGPFGSDLKSSHYTESGVKVLQLQNIGEGKFIEKGGVFISEKKANELMSCNIYPDEILLAKMAPVARCCKVPSTERRYVMSSDGIRLSVDRTKFDNEFVFQALNSDYFRNSAEAQSTGTTRARIGLSDLKLIPILLPPLQEQEKIAEILSKADEKIDILQEKKKAYQTMKKGLMQVLLTGQVRVKEGVINS